MTVARILRSGWLPALAAGTLHFVIAVVYLVPFRGDPSAFVCLEERLRGQPPFESVCAGLTPDGYDGEFYYAIAQNPWSRQGPVIDHPSLRHARLLFPAAAWAFTAGDRDALLWAMPLLNLAAIMGIAWLGTILARNYGRNIWWGFLLPFAINCSAPALRDLTDTSAALCVVGLLTSHLIRQPAWQTTCWAAACVLSREQNIAIVAIVALDALLSWQWRNAAGMSFAATLWAVWLVTLKQMYGFWPSAAINVSGPFEGMAYRWMHLAGSGGRMSLAANGARMVLLSLQFLTLSYVAMRGERLVRLLAVAAIGLAGIAGQGIYGDVFSYGRVLNWMPLACWIWAVQSRKRWPALILAPAFTWPLIEVIKVWR